MNLASANAGLSWESLRDTFHIEGGLDQLFLGVQFPQFQLKVPLNPESMYQYLLRHGLRKQTQILFGSVSSFSLYLPNLIDRTQHRTMIARKFEKSSTKSSSGKWLQ